MRPYWAIFAARARTLFQYRAAAFAGLVTQWVFGLVMVSVLTAFYRHANSVQPLALAQTITYTWIGQATLSLQPWNIDRDVGESVRTGAVAYDLTRPMDLYGYWYARALAMRSIPMLMRAIPMFLIATFLMPEGFQMTWPNASALVAWVAATFGAMLLSCAVTLWMQSTLFFSVAGDGITRIVPSFVTLFSGMVIPLPLFPDWAQGFLRFQPFAALVDLPARLFVGGLAPGEVLFVLALQIIWTAAFALLGRATIKRGMRRLAVAGG